VDRVAQRYGVLPSVLLGADELSPYAKYMLNMKIATIGSQEDKKEMDKQKLRRKR
jgi:hypothetical protein